MCTHRLDNDPNGLLCDRTTPHDETARGGHTYHSTSGVPDAPKEEL